MIAERRYSMHGFRTIPIICLLLFGFGVDVLHAGSRAQGRGVVSVAIEDHEGRQVGLYRESHALVIGVAGYHNGWPKLPGARRDVTAVAEALIDNGFQVKTVLDPSSDQLAKAFEDFIIQYGRKAENRLLFYFAGHGHTVKPKWGNPMGYIVPKDAPNPNRDEAGFEALALPMQRIEEYALKIRAKHAIFLFDSCFSGSLFAITRSVPENISARTAEPVRQFITAGTEKETVPDESIFRRQFVAALAGEGDMNGDGFLTGVELGEFLHEKVANYSKGSQHPQYGKIRNPHLDKGDFVFRIMAQGPAVSAKNTQAPIEAPAYPGTAGPAMELEFWNNIKQRKDPDMFRAYLEQYPKGSFAALAELKIKKLESQSVKSSLQTGSRTGPQTAWVMGTAQGAFAHPTKLIVRSNVSGDTVYLDGKAMGPTGAVPHILSPGEHTIRVEKQGFEPFETKITLTAGTKKTIRARLMPVTTVGWAKAPSAVPINQSKTGSQAGARTGSRTGARTGSRTGARTGARTGSQTASVMGTAQGAFAHPTPGQTFRDRLKDGSLGPQMMVIPAGEFRMGSPKGDGNSYEHPQHRVRIKNAFALGVTEVTFQEYDRFARATGRKLPDDTGWGRGKRPVIYVSWKDATAYAKWLSGQTGQQYRLPTEAEWEYAARAGTTTPFSTGDCITTSQANYDGNYDYANCGAKTGVYRGETVPAGSLPANPWGLHEMHGNVWEWMADCWHDSYGGAPTDGGAWGEENNGDCSRRVVRGGAWFNFPWRLRSAVRSDRNANEADFYTGFRLARGM